MDIHKNARLTPLGRERLVADKSISKEEYARLRARIVE